MFFMVYRTRFQGVRADQEAVRSGGIAGELRLHRRGMGRCAQLLAQDGETYLVPVLDRVRVLHIDTRGMLLAGIECYPGRSVKRDGPRYPQAWWCVPARPPFVRSPALVAREEADQRRAAHEIGRTMS